MSNGHKRTSPRRKAKGRQPDEAMLPFRCEDCNRLNIRVVHRLDMKDRSDKCDGCGRWTKQRRIYKRIDKAILDGALFGL